MEYDKKYNELRINLKKESYDPITLTQYRDIKTLRIGDISSQIELPIELLDLPELEELYITGLGRDNTYLPPINLEKLTNIKKLTLWSYCELEELPVLPHIESFNVVVRDTYSDVKTISQKFPNLRSMELWGSHAKSGRLPKEITTFIKLERLELVSCGLKTLPPQFAQLTSLKTLNLRGLPMREFPEVLCKMENLEELELKQSIVDLPEDFSNLKSLKKLNLKTAFNDGIMDPIDPWTGKQAYLHPIPSVIGKLPSLESLNLDYCGVVDLEFLKDAVNLKELSIQSSGLKNCDTFSHFRHLTTLELHDSSVLKDIDGLKNMELHELNLEDCDNISSIDVISSLKELKKLNIKGCDEIEELDPIYSHNTLNELVADDSVMEQWELKEKIKQLPPLESVIENITTDDMSIFESAINSLKIYVDKNYQSGNNPLAGYFNREVDDESILSIEVLDSSFNKFKDRLSNELILLLIDISFRSVGRDNYKITILCIEELIKRADAEAQKHVVNQYKKATSYYDYGHRYWGETVLDKLYDDLFPQFETEALITLLSIGHSDMLNSESGDGVDSCYAPAFHRVTSEEEYSSLTELFFNYYEECIGYYGSEYFSKLITSITEAVPDKYREEFKSLAVKRGQKYQYLSKMESYESEDIIFILKNLEDIDEELLDEKDYEVINNMNDADDIPKDLLLNATNFFFRRKSSPSYIYDSIYYNILPDGMDRVVEYLSKWDESYNDYITTVTANLIKRMNLENCEMEEIDRLRSFYTSVNNSSINSLYEMEVCNLFMVIVRQNIYSNRRDALLNRVEFICSKIEGPLRFSKADFKFNLSFLTDNRENLEIIKSLCRYIYPVMDLKVVEKSLYLPVVAAVETGDREYYLHLKQYIPNEITSDILAYNLACASACFNEKSEMLEYIKISLKLGKTTQQFLDDKDFSLYISDEDFVEVMNP